MEAGPGAGLFDSGGLYEEIQIIDNQRITGFDPALSLALDQRLWETNRAPALRIYRWNQPCGTFGYLQKYQDIQRFRNRDDARPWFRRMTGGGALEHGLDETGLTFFFPGKTGIAGRSAKVIYREIHRSMADALEAAGLPVQMIPDSEASAGGATCLDHPVADDIAMKGEKIGGGALRRGRRGVLYQGILKTSLPDGFAEELAGRLGFAANFVDWPGESDLREANALADERYRNEAWLLKR